MDGGVLEVKLSQTLLPNQFLDELGLLAADGDLNVADLDFNHIDFGCFRLSAHGSGSPDSLKDSVELGGLSLIDLLNLLWRAAALISIDQDGLDFALSAARQAILWSLGSAFLMILLVLVKAPRTDYSFAQYSATA